VPVLIASVAVIARQEGLDHRAGFILSMIDGVASLDDITDASGMTAADVQRLVDTLVERGLVGLKSV
jgi:DNA-binding IclR family transcriptional regulator